VRPRLHLLPASTSRLTRAHPCRGRLLRFLSSQALRTVKLGAEGRGTARAVSTPCAVSGPCIAHGALRPTLALRPRY